MIIGVIGGLLMLEPDLGTFAAIACTGVVMFFLAGAALRHMVMLLVGGSAVLFAIVAGAGYGMERIRTFFNAEDVAQEAGFQIINLVSTLGSGGLTGVGLGASRQKFFYVPSAHTDGVFAIIGEETGMLGAMIVLTIFAVLIYRGIRAGMRAEDRFGTLLAFGIVAWFALQAFFQRCRRHAHDRPDRHSLAIPQLRFLGPHFIYGRRRHPGFHLQTQPRQHARPGRPTALRCSANART